MIPESLNKTSYWYRTTFTVPKDYAHRQVWVHFDGANFTSEVWVNGSQVGTIQGAFIRGRFDITKYVKPGETAVLAVRVSPQPHPGVPHEHNIANGVGKNGGITAIDGPTFLCTIGWDWLQAVRDRDTGTVAEGLAVGVGAGAGGRSAGDYGSAAAADGHGRRDGEGGDREHVGQKADVARWKAALATCSFRRR